MAKILVVDDEYAIRTYFQAFLESLGHQVFTASNGREAILFFERHNPQLVFMDISMPELNGITAAKRILKINPKVPIIMVTAVAYKEMVVKAVQEGIKTFIVKPFELETILKALAKLGIASGGSDETSDVMESTLSSKAKLIQETEAKNPDFLKTDSVEIFGDDYSTRRLTNTLEEQKQEILNTGQVKSDAIPPEAMESDSDTSSLFDDEDFMNDALLSD